jgi:hypothetical protein
MNFSSSHDIYLCIGLMTPPIFGPYIITVQVRRPNYNFMQREVQPFEPESCITHASESCTSLVKTEAKDQFSILDAPKEGLSSSSREPNSSNTVNSSDNCNDKRLGNINGYPANTATCEQIRKRKRSKVCKNTEEVEIQRMTHIVVERNRRKQMNQHLTVLRSLMPVSFIQRVRVLHHYNIIPLFL